MFSCQRKRLVSTRRCSRMELVYEYHVSSHWVCNDHDARFVSRILSGQPQDHQVFASLTPFAFLTITRCDTLNGQYPQS